MVLQPSTWGAMSHLYPNGEDLKPGIRDLCFETTWGVTLAAAICPQHVFKRAEILLYFYYMSNFGFIALSPPPPCRR